jgi:hypothetical protein
LRKEFGHVTFEGFHRVPGGRSPRWCWGQKRPPAKETPIKEYRVAEQQNGTDETAVEGAADLRGQGTWKAEVEEDPREEGPRN